jgi:hypothetical protein
LYGDTAVIRALARGLRERADRLREEAGDLGRWTASAPWRGLAADAMRQAAIGHADDLRRCADAHDRAADAFTRHAREVDRVKDLVAAAEHQVHDALDSVASGVGGLLDQLPSRP